MDFNLLPSIFFTLFLVVDPLGLIPVFISYLSGFSSKSRRRIVFRANIIAIFVSIFFILAGNIILHFIGITPGAFLIAGGVLLFMISVDMLFARPTRTKIAEGDSQEFDKKENDISVFPLAIPLLCGPGNIAALLMFSSLANGETIYLLTIILISASVFIISALIMLTSVYIEKILKETGISIIQRIMGLILSAMAVQFIINGLKQIGLIIE